MHGVKRESNIGIQEQIARDNEELIQVHHYLSTVQKFQAARDSLDTDQMLEASKELLLLNPEHYTAWNVRRQALLSKVNTLSAEASVLSLSDLLKAELEFNVGAVKSNVKSYSAWHHRRWLVQTILAPRERNGSCAFDHNYELKLCTKLLDLDSRNFHCWNYRTFISQWFGVAPVEELNFTTAKINQNFSNYSAWHHRSRLMPLVYPDSSAEKDAAIANGTVAWAKEHWFMTAVAVLDLSVVQSAYFTEPADQSPWFYLRWLISFIDKDQRQAQLQVELSHLAELIKIEPDAPSTC